MRKNINTSSAWQELLLHFKRLGQYVAVDSYENALAMHVSNDHEVTDWIS